jgi:MATE family multidrug resistance protein
VTALVGRYIGAGRPELAERRAHLGFVISAVYMVSAGVMLTVFRHWLIARFSVDPEVIRIGGTIIVMMAIYQIFDAMYVVYNGALRGAGDTLVPAIVLAALVWGVGLGGGYWAAVTWPQYGVVSPWTVMTLYGALLGVFLMLRFLGGRWKRIRLDRTDQKLPASNQPGVSATLEPVTVG